IGGEFHAERAALNHCTESGGGADRYVTREPCSHHGKTTTFSDAIIEAGSKRVYYDSRDENSNGDGLNALKDRANDPVPSPHPDIDALYRPFYTTMKDKRPFITLKRALTLDGKMARENGDSHWVSNELSRQDVHQLPQQHDGILIGGHTLRNDNPSLTTRLSDNDKHPVPVILLGSQKLKLDMKTVKQH